METWRGGNANSNYFHFQFFIQRMYIGSYFLFIRSDWTNISSTLSFRRHSFSHHRPQHSNYRPMSNRKAEREWEEGKLNESQCMTGGLLVKQYREGNQFNILHFLRFGKIEMEMNERRNEVWKKWKKTSIEIYQHNYLGFILKWSIKSIQQMHFFSQLLAAGW